MTQSHRTLINFSLPASPTTRLHCTPARSIPFRGLCAATRYPLAARAPEARCACPRPVMCAPHRLIARSSHLLVFCVHSRAFSQHGALRLSLWLAALCHAASLKVRLCQGHDRAVATRAGARCRLALRPGVLAVCMVAPSAVVCAVSEPPFWLPFEPEALSRRIWRVAGEKRAAVRASRMRRASVERACGASASLTCIVPAPCTRTSSAQ